MFCHPIWGFSILPTSSPLCPQPLLESVTVIVGSLWDFKGLFICSITQEAFQTWINCSLKETTYVGAVINQIYG